MQQDGNRVFWFRVYSHNHPQGASSTTYPTPRPFVSHSHQLHHSSFPFSQSDQGVLCGTRAHFDSVICLCNKIKPSPFLPDWIRRTSRFIGKSVSNSFWRLMELYAFFFSPSDRRWRVPTVWSRATHLTLSFASHCLFLFAKAGEHCCFLIKRFFSGRQSVPGL